MDYTESLDIEIRYIILHSHQFSTEITSYFELL